MRFEAFLGSSAAMPRADTNDAGMRGGLRTKLERSVDPRVPRNSAGMVARRGSRCSAPRSPTVAVAEFLRSIITVVEQHHGDHDGWGATVEAQASS